MISLSSICYVNPVQSYLLGVNMEDILVVDHLTKQFGDFTAVDGISFRVAKGEIVGLLGPNGAGKTTTISMIMGFTLPTAGRVEVFGKEFATNRQEILARTNYASAYTKIPYRLTVWQYLFMFSLLYDVAKPKDKIRSLLKTFQIEEHAGTIGEDLSSGNTARVNLCKAFINNPELILLDEPTSSMDPDIADQVRTHIAQAQRKFQTTVLITSHNMAEIEELCDRVIFVNHGKIIAVDTPEALAKRMDITKVKLLMKDGQKRTIAYCQKHNLLIEAQERSVTISIKEEAIAEFLSDLAKLGVEYASISIQSPTLEDYFIGEVRHA
ncbi:MAG: ABC transporter, ATPase subunit [Candidatus Gottesmanbacteria bacterium GW2011_GWB1_44_11c]|uniref:ABC transporter, ATPase subunit n=3 Tax=Candidatus Gottesmaniibacteriota TaxID=1752720 RepID=A0A0G1GUS8_9BACT|nr:MAG: ABC transporter, ATPase subunit [Candidatus Gottesmanbacteria bacterium GW2011_GWB1_44_11c]